MNIVRSGTIVIIPRNYNSKEKDCALSTGMFCIIDLEAAFVLRRMAIAREQHDPVLEFAAKQFF